MAEIINLRMARKARARREAAARADVNRAAFGRTKAEKDAGEDARARVARVVDGARLEGDGD